MKSSRNKGFTLIELLVVISIIGLLSSVVLASVNTARDKGQKAAGQQFAGHNLSLLGASAFGYYDFNTGSGSAVDFSQYRRDGTLVGATYTSITPNKSPWALSFDTDKYMTIGGAASYGPLTSFTLMAWVNPTPSVTHDNDTLMAFGQTATDVLQLKNGQLTYYYTGIPSQLVASTKVKDGVWTHIAVVVENAAFKYYINGREVPYTGSFQVGYQLPMLTQLGRFAFDNIRDYKGLMDDVGVFPTALTFTQLQEIYAQGLPEHTLAQVQ